MLLTLGPIACGPQPQPKQGTAVANAAERWRDPQTFGNSQHPGRKYTIRMLPGFYRPGDQPMGVGAHLRQLRLIADEYEASHPDVAIEYPLQAVIAGGSEGEWLRTQMLGGVAPEIVALNTEAVWPDVDKHWWLSMDPWLAKPNPYIPGNKRWVDSFANIPFLLSRRAPDGKLYCISFDMSELGIYYNKNIFAREHLGIPKTWKEFLEIQRKLKSGGYIPFLAYLQVCAQDWGPDYLFDQLYHRQAAELKFSAGGQAEGGQAVDHLSPPELCWAIERGRFSATDQRYREVWRLLCEWRAYWQKDLSHTDIWRLFVTERAAMLWDGSWLMRRIQNDPQIGFEWGVFYLPPLVPDDSPLASGVDPCVMGGNATQLHVTKSAWDVPGKLERVMDFLMYMTTSQNCERIVGEAGMYIPNIAGARMNPAMNVFYEISRRRYCTAKWMYSLDHEFNEWRERNIHLFLGDGLTLDQFMEAMERDQKAAADRMIARFGWRYEGPGDPAAQAAAARLGVPYQPKAAEQAK